MTQLGRHSSRENFRNRVANLRIAAALTISVSRNHEADGSQDGIQPSAAEVFDRSLLPQVRNFVSCVKIDPASKGRNDPASEARIRPYKKRGIFFSNKPPYQRVNWGL